MNDAHDNAMTDMEFLQKHSPPEPATYRQLSYFHDLVRERDMSDMVKKLPDQWLSLLYDTIKALKDKGAIDVYKSQVFAKKDLIKFISELRNQPKLQEMAKWQEASKVTTPRPGVFTTTVVNGSGELEDGMYRHPQQGTIYKVYHTVQGNNIQVAKRLAVINEPPIADVVLTHDDQVYELKNRPSKPTTVKFKYEGRAPLKFLKPEMRLTLQEAREFGALYGTCCICGRTLTNELSIQLGIGPVCGKREFGGEFEFMINGAKIETELPDDEAAIKARLTEIDKELGA